MNALEQLLTDNKHIGFDVLAQNTGVDKEDLKKLHNKLGLGLKRFPNTCFANYFEPVRDENGFIKREGGRPVYKCIKTWSWFNQDGKLGVFRKGDTTDLLSVPKFGWWFLDTADPTAVLASLPHDQETAQMYPNKLIADYRFFKDLLYLQVNPFKALVAYVAVSFGSFAYFFKDRKKARAIRLKNEISYWKYIEEKNLPKVMAKIYQKQLKQLGK